MKKILRIITKVLIILFILILLFVFINYIIHKIKLNNEYKNLKEAEYINKYSAGDYDLNVYRIGNENSKYKLICISGLGINNYSIEMSFVNEILKYDLEFIYIDRAGYGYSDDTSKKQTVEQIVSDYRVALKNAGIKGNYILMPHSLGGIYATYWESMYPDEIEGVIFIDSSEVGLNAWDESEYNVGITDYLELVACKLGLHRLVLNNYYYPLPSNYSDENQKFTDYLNVNSALTKAKISEITEINNNTNKTYENIKKNDIPKIYINANTGFRTKEEIKEYIKWVNNRMSELGKEKTQILSDKTMKKLLTDYQKWTDEKIKPYIESLGNTELILLPGDHMIFEQKPDDLANIIKKFVENLD